MAEEKSMGKFFVYICLTLILLLIMIPVIFSFSGKVIKLEIFGLVFLVLLSLIGFLAYQRSWGERVLFFVFVFNLANLVLIWYFTNRLFILPLFLTIIGFLMGLPKKTEEWDFDEPSEPQTEVKPYTEPQVEDSSPEANKVEIIENKTVEKKPAKKKTKYSPGKYVASKAGTVYHEPKCEWAKRIVKQRRIWFNDKKSANRKGYRGHSCVK